MHNIAQSICSQTGRDMTMQKITNMERCEIHVSNADVGQTHAAHRSSGQPEHLRVVQDSRMQKNRRGAEQDRREAARDRREGTRDRRRATRDRRGADARWCGTDARWRSTGARRRGTDARWRGA